MYHPQGAIPQMEDRGLKRLREKAASKLHSREEHELS
jgi:hypothetical protein